MIDRRLDNPVSPLLEDEVRDAYRFTQGIDFLSGDIGQTINHPLRASLARFGQWVLNLVTIAGLGYGMAVAPHDTKRMATSFLIATAACITAMGLEAYRKRQIPYGTD